MNQGQSPPDERPQGTGKEVPIVIIEEPPHMRSTARRPSVLMSPRQIGDRFGLTRRQVLGLVQRKTLPAIQDGSRYKIRLADAERLFGGSDAHAA